MYKKAKQSKTIKLSSPRMNHSLDAIEVIKQVQRISFHSNPTDFCRLVCASAASFGSGEGELPFTSTYSRFNSSTFSVFPSSASGGAAVSLAGGASGSADPLGSAAAGDLVTGRTPLPAPDDEP